MEHVIYKVIHIDIARSMSEARMIMGTSYIVRYSYALEKKRNGHLGT